MLVVCLLPWKINKDVDFLAKRKFVIIDCCYAGCMIGPNLTEEKTWKERSVDVEGLVELLVKYFCTQHSDRFVFGNKLRSVSCRKTLNLISSFWDDTYLMFWIHSYPAKVFKHKLITCPYEQKILQKFKTLFLIDWETVQTYLVIVYVSSRV